MRHLLYWLFLGLALVVAAIFALPFMMTECQFHTTQAEIDRCFGASFWAIRAYGIGLIGFAIVSLVLYVRNSRSALVGTAAVAVGPIASGLLTSMIYRLF